MKGHLDSLSELHSFAAVSTCKMPCVLPAVLQLASVKGHRSDPPQPPSLRVSVGREFFL